MSTDRDLIARYGIDPRRPGAPEKFERAIEEWGMHGIKLYATAGYFPHDRILECVMEASAGYLITGDRKHLLPLGEHRGVKILSAPRFLSVLGSV